MSFFFNTLAQGQISPEKLSKSGKIPIISLATRFSKDFSPEKVHNLSLLLYKLNHKFAISRYKCLTSAFIKLFANEKSLILLQIMLEKIHCLIFSKNRRFLLFFFSKISRKPLIWHNPKEKMLKNLSFNDKLNEKSFNRMKKIMNDISSGEKSLENMVKFSDCKLFLSEKFGSKILQLFFSSQRKNSLFFSIRKLRENTGFFMKNPEIIKNYLMKKESEKEEFEFFMKNGHSNGKKKKINQQNIMALHNRELYGIKEKLDKEFNEEKNNEEFINEQKTFEKAHENSIEKFNEKTIEKINKKGSLRKRENLILYNWAFQQINRILKYYRREFLIISFTTILRNSYKKKFNKKLLINLYEKYRCHRIKDLTNSFMCWKMKAFNIKGFININHLFYLLNNLRIKLKRQFFMQFLGNLQRKNLKNEVWENYKLKSAVSIGKFIGKKTILLMENAFSRIKHEKYLIEIADKINSIDKFTGFFRKKVLKTVFFTLKRNEKDLKDHEKLMNVLKYIVKIRKVICFYKLQCFSELMREKNERIVNFA